MPGSESAASYDAIAASDLYLFELVNKRGVKLTFSPVGAALMSLLLPDSEGKTTDIVLGYDEPGLYLRDDYYLGAVVGRYANRITGNQVNINGTVYALRSKDERYHHHGGVEGFNKKLFKGRLLQEAGAAGVEFTYTSAHLEEGYPGEFRLTVKYLLTEDNEWVIEFNGLADRDTIVNTTQHAYFNLAGHASGGVEQHQLQLFANHYLPVNQLQVPTGVIAPVAGTVFDFTRSRPIGELLEQRDEQLVLGGGYDHSFVLESRHTPALKYAARVYQPVSGISMELWTTEPSVHFYAGNFLENVQGKQGAVYGRRAGFCLETQHFPDSPNQPAFPSTLLRAGQPYYSKTVFKFS